MDSHRFDSLVKAIVAGSVPRRPLLAGLGGGMLALAARRIPDGVLAKDEERKKRKKRKKKPLKRNEYGCVPVGKACRGRDSVCCSGICEGKKPKKGERDRSQCVAHDTGGCQQGEQTGFCRGSGVGTPCTPSEGPFGTCETTTGNAGFCVFTGNCETCHTDPECQASTGNPLAACIRCAAGCPEGTACVIP